MMPLWLGLVALMACGSSEPAKEAPDLEGASSSRPSIVFVVVDGLRSDRVHGFSPKQPDLLHPMPKVQAWSGKATRFGRTYAATPRVLSSTVSLLTGVPVRSHGVIASDRVLVPTFLTLAQHLSVVGYATHAVVESHEAWKSPDSRLERGFDEIQRISGDAGPTSGRIVELARKRWDRQLQDAPEQPLFLYLQLGDPLPPFTDHPDIDFGDTPDGRYREELYSVDEQLGDWLPKLGKNALVVLTSSVGVNLGEHEGDALSLYEENIRVPTLIRAPRLPAADIPRPLGAVDIGATVLGIAGVPNCPTSLGQRLPQDEFGRIKVRNKRAVYSEALDGADATVGVMGQTKLVRDRTNDSWRLFELSTDPAEREDAKKGNGGNPNYVKLQRAILALEKVAVFEAARTKSPQVDTP